jgi:hypothetical protein
MDSYARQAGLFVRGTTRALLARRTKAKAASCGRGGGVPRVLVGRKGEGWAEVGGIGCWPCPNQKGRETGVQQPPSLASPFPLVLGHQKNDYNRFSFPQENVFPHVIYRFLFILLFAQADEQVAAVYCLSFLRSFSSASLDLARSTRSLMRSGGSRGMEDVTCELPVQRQRRAREEQESKTYTSWPFSARILSMFMMKGM